MKKSSMHIVIALLAIVFSLSCKSILLKFAGVGKPKLETMSSIEEFVSEYQVEGNQVLYCKDSLAFDKMLKAFPIFPGVYVFNSDGLLVKHLDDDECVNTNEILLANDLSWVNSLSPIDPPVSLEDVNSALIDHEFRAYPIPADPGKVTVIITFTKWLGKKFNGRTFHFYKESNRVKNDVFLLNLDFMDFYGLDPEDVRFNK